MKKTENKKKKEINNNEKKEILSNDLIERMINVEKRVGKSFGENKSYKQTDYYKSLTKDEKKSFENYLRNKKTKKKILSSLFLMVFLGFGFFNIELTGNAISDTLGESNYFIFYEALLIVLLVGCFFVLGYFFINFLRKKKFDSYFHPIDNVIIKRYLKKKI